MQYYDAISNGYNNLHSEEQLEKARIIKRELNPHGLLLDVGAGTGIATSIFEDCCNCTALDPSIELLKQYSGTKVVGRAEYLPFKDNSFDCVVSITALHHADLERAFSEIQRVAKPNAKIGVSFFKRAANFPQAKRLFAGFECIEQKFDVIFLKK